jgi:hypothetical protein
VVFVALEERPKAFTRVKLNVPGLTNERTKGVRKIPKIQVMNFNKEIF